MIEGLCLLILLMCGIYSGHRLFLLGIYLYAKHNEKNRPPKYTVSSAPPKITIQLPVFNERYVVKRLIDAVCSIRYPRHLLEIQVLDDSDDDTCDILDTLVETYRIQGHPIQTVRRGSRTGYKAGALQHGLRSAKGEWILIFDSDFIPNPTCWSRPCRI